jgi:hypothetical protein
MRISIENGTKFLEISMAYCHTGVGWSLELIEREWLQLSIALPKNISDPSRGQRSDKRRREYCILNNRQQVSLIRTAIVLDWWWLLAA